MQAKRLRQHQYFIRPSGANRGRHATPHQEGPYLMEGSWSPFEVLGLSQAQLLSAIMKLIRVVAPHFVAGFETDG